MLKLSRPASATEVLDTVGDWLALNEPRHQFLLGVLARAASEPEEGRGRYFAVVRDSGRPCGVLAESPGNLVVSGLTEGGIETLARDLDQRFSELPAIFGPEAAALGVAGAVGALRGARAECRLRSTLYLLGDLRPPEPPIPGRFRQATERDVERAQAWLEAFRLESMPAQLKTGPIARRLIGSGDLFFWSLGEDVALGGVAGRSPRGARLGWIYTPPEHRGRGFGSAISFRLSRHLLEHGAGFCCLYADLANPVANRLYRRLGYHEIERAAEVVLVPNDPSSPLS